MDMLRAMEGRGWLHMPGHGGDLPWLDAALDVTELPVSDDLHDPLSGGPMERAQELAAQACGAGATLFLTGGSTLGIHAMLTAYVPPGGKVILPRDAHKAAVAACALGDLRPVYVWPRVWEQKALPDVEDVLRAVQEHPDAQVLYLTRPDYFGVALELAPIVQAAHSVGMRVLVDEAHGAHFPYGGDVLSAGELGADAWVQSAHKTLPAMTQAAYLHMRDARDKETFAERIALLGTSSPSFLIAASLDAARAHFAQNGKSIIEHAVCRNERFHKRIQKLGVTNAYAAWRAQGYACDGTRIVLDVRALGRSGYEVSAVLSAAGIDVEMADAFRIVALPPLEGGGEHVEWLAEALEAIPRGRDRVPVPSWEFPRLAQVVPPRAAVFGQKEWVPADGAVGRVAACSVGLYPPGIPLATPGECLTADFLRALTAARDAGAKLFGVREEDHFLVVKEATSKR